VDSSTAAADSIAKMLASQEKHSETATAPSPSEQTVDELVQDDVVQEDSDDSEEGKVAPLPSLAQMTYRVHPMAVPVRFASHLLAKARAAVSEPPTAGDSHPLFSSVVHSVQKAGSNTRLVAKAKRLSTIARGLPHPGAGASVLMQWGSFFGTDADDTEMEQKKPAAKQQKKKKVAKGFKAVSKLLLSKASATVAYTKARAKKLIDTVSEEVSASAARREYSKIIKAKVKASIQAHVLKRQAQTLKTQAYAAVKQRKLEEVKAQGQAYAAVKQRKLEEVKAQGQAVAADKERKVEEVKAQGQAVAADKERKVEEVKAEALKKQEEAKTERAEEANKVALKATAQKKEESEMAVQAKDQRAKEDREAENKRAKEAAEAKKYVVDHEEEIQQLKTEAAKAEEHGEELRAEERASMEHQIAKQQEKSGAKVKKQVSEYKKVRAHSVSLEKEAAETGDAVQDWKKEAIEEAKKQADKLKETLAAKRHEMENKDDEDDHDRKKASSDEVDEASVETELEDASERGDAVDSLIARANRVLHPKTAKSVDRVLNKAKDELEALQEPDEDEEDIDIDLVSKQSPAEDQDPDADMEQMLPRPADIAATPGVLVLKQDDGSVDVERLHANNMED